MNVIEKAFDVLQRGGRVLHNDAAVTIVDGHLHARGRDVHVTEDLMKEDFWIFVEPKTPDPGWVDVPLFLEEHGGYLFTPATCHSRPMRLDSAMAHSRFLGYVYDINGERECWDKPVLFRGGSGGTYSRWYGGCTVLRPVAVRMRV